MGELARESSRLWACHLCELIGVHEDAMHHAVRTGHTITELNDETSAKVRALWRAEGDPRGVDAELLREGEAVDG